MIIDQAHVADVLVDYRMGVWEEQARIEPAPGAPPSSRSAEIPPAEALTRDRMIRGGRTPCFLVADRGPRPGVRARRAGLRAISGAGREAGISL
jgi:hypothetical protein